MDRSLVYSVPLDEDVDSVQIDGESEIDVRSDVARPPGPSGWRETGRRVIPRRVLSGNMFWSCFQLP